MWTLSVLQLNAWDAWTDRAILLTSQNWPKTDACYISCCRQRGFIFVAQTDILRRTSQPLSEGELVRKKHFFCIASNSTRNSLIVLYTNCTVLNAPSQRSNAKIYLSSGSASLQTFKRLTRKYAKLLSIILRPKVQVVTSCESCKQASNNDSILIPG